MYNRLAALWRRGTDFLGCEHAIMGGAMSWLSEANLVAALSEAGAFGVIASGNMPVELFRQEIRKTREKTSKPFGVNLITMNPALPDLIRVTVEEKVSHCVLAGGLPPGSAIDALKQGGVKVIAFAPSAALGRRLVKQGVDALVIEGHEAGGHVGPVSTLVLMQEILPHVSEVPVFVAGGIGTGSMMATLLGMGAAGCQIGTLLVCSDECVAHDNFKQAFIRANARDAAVTSQFDPILPVIPVRALVNKGTDTFNRLQLDLVRQVREGSKDRKTAQLELEHFWVGALRRAAMDGDVEGGSVMAGQVVGLVNRVRPIREILAELLEGAEMELSKLADKG